jgi:hypothetical protein
MFNFLQTPNAQLDKKRANFSKTSNVGRTTSFMLLLVSFIIGMLWSGDAVAQLYVNPSTGNDANTGLSTALPKQSLRGALRALTAPGTTIYIMEGDYAYGVMTNNANRSLGFGPGQSVTTGITNANLPGTVIEGIGCVYWHNSNDDGTGAQNPIMTVESVNGFTVRNINFLGWQGSNASMMFINCPNVLVENCNFHQSALNSATALRFEGDATETTIAGLPSLNYTINNCTFQSNGNPSGQGTGQALYIRNNGNSTSGTFSVTVKNSRFDCNYAATGGAVYAFAQNAADKHPQVSFTDCSFSGNYASSQGGGVFAKYADLTITGSSFCGNRTAALTDRDGGAIHVDQGASLIATGCYFKENQAGRYGSAISVASNALNTNTITNCTFDGNGGTTGTASSTIRTGGGVTAVNGCLLINNGGTGPAISGATVSNTTLSGNAGAAVTGSNVIDANALPANTWIDPTYHAFNPNGTQVGFTGAYQTLTCPACPAKPAAGTCEAYAGSILNSASPACYYICSDTITETTGASNTGTITINSVAGFNGANCATNTYSYYFLVLDAGGNVVKVIDGDTDNDGVPNFAESPAVPTDVSLAGLPSAGVYSIVGYYTNGAMPALGTAPSSAGATCATQTGGAIKITVLDPIRIDMTRSCKTTPGNVQAPDGQFYINIASVTGGFANLNPTFFTPKSYTLTTSFGAGSYSYTGTAINNIAVNYAAGTNETAQATSYTPQPSTCSNCQSQVFEELDLNCAAAPISISGNVFNDANGLTDNTVNGTAINGTTLVTYANLVSGGNVVQSVQISPTGTYTFPNVSANTTYTVILSTTAQTVGNPLSAAVVPTGYVSTGENIGTGTGNDGTPANGQITVAVTTASVTEVNLGIQQPPTANPVTASSQLNPGGTTQVTVPTLTGSDPEDGTYNGTSGTNDIIIQTVPNPVTEGNLYYNGVLVTVGQPITNYNPTLLTVDPIDGTVTVTFTYSEVDAAGLVSPAANVSMPFAPISISGNVFNDANGLTDNTVNGTAINGTTLVTYANLVSGGNVVQSVQISPTGTYTFPNVSANTTYTVILTTTAQTVGTPLSTAVVPTGYVSTGENIGTGTGNDGTPANGQITVAVATTSVTEVNLGIQQPPTANPVTASSQLNPSGTTQVTVPTLTGSDPEDGTYNGTSGTNDIIIVTLPANGTLYYNGVAITTPNFAINNYNPTLLTVDPIDGTVTVTFTYSEVDAGNLVSPAATVNIPFAPISISGNVFNDANGLTDNTVNGTAINGTTLVTYANLVSGGNVVQSVQISSTGTYTFPNVSANTTYTVILTTTAQTVGTPLSTAVVPTGYTSTGQNIGTGAGDDTTPANGQITVAVTTTSVTEVNLGITQLTDLSLVKTVSNATPDVGTNVTFTITVNNAGPSAATGVTVTDQLPSGYTYVSDNGAGAYNSGTGVWTVAGSIANGGSASLTITATVLATGTYLNMAQVTAAGQLDLDSTPNNNVSTEDDQDDVIVTPATSCNANHGTWIH